MLHWSQRWAIILRALMKLIRTAKKLLKKGYSGNRFDTKNEIAKIPDIIYELPPMDLIPHSLYKYYDKVKKIAMSSITDSLIMVNYCEQKPNFHSRMYLSNEKDFLGQRKVIMDWKIDDKEIESLIKIQNLINESFKSLNLGYADQLINKDHIDEFSDASHHMGTTRMSNNFKDGVVDVNCKVFSISNLYVAGSSVFPSSGHANPTLTIAALSIKLAEHIIEKFKLNKYND